MWNFYTGVFWRWTARGTLGTCRGYYPRGAAAAFYNDLLELLYLNCFILIHFGLIFTRFIIDFGMLHSHNKKLCNMVTFKLCYICLPGTMQHSQISIMHHSFQTLCNIVIWPICNICLDIPYVTYVTYA